MNIFFDEIKNIINTHDLIPKLISLLLAVILWANIVNTQIGEVTFKIPVEYKNIPESLIVLENESPLVPVNFKGKKDLLRNINTKNIMVYVDLRNPEVNKATQYPISLSRGELSENIEISTTKKFITLTIERKVSNKIPVSVDISNDQPEKFILGSLIVIPSHVTVTGPDSIVTSLKSIETEPVQINSAKSNIDTTVSANISDFRKITVKPDTFQVKISVYHISNLHSIKVPLNIINVSDEERIKVSPPHITVYIKKTDETTKPDSNDFRAYIDYNSIDISVLENQREISFPLKLVKLNYLTGDKASIVKVKPESLTMKLINTKSSN